MRPRRTRASLRAAFAFDKFTQKNLSDERTSFPPAPHDRKTCPQINIELWRKHQNTPLLDAETKPCKLAKRQRNSWRNLARKGFLRGHFDFTGKLSLAAYATSSTSPHYDRAKR